MGWWTRGPIIGRGSSAAVSLATTASGELLAVKSADLSCSTLLQRENFLISQLSSPYIVKYLGSDITSENGKHFYNLLMEYAPDGTLSDQIRKQGGSLEEPMIQAFAHQILKGLHYLHTNGIVHCDIKGQNVLIGQNGAKIGDFGCAKMVEEGNLMAGKLKPVISGTPLFMAPEVARGEEQGFAADIWALGCTIIEMATGKNPWPQLEDPVSALYKIGYSEDVPEFPWWISDCAKDFLSKCLKRDAKERWTAEELLQHSFFHGDCMEEKEAEFARNTPTTVLDQDFWDSMEASETESSSLQDSSHIVFSLGSPADRINNLMGNPVSVNSDFPDWTDDGDWITVRDSDSEEIPQFSQQTENSAEDPEGNDSQLTVDSFLYSIILEEQLGSSIVVDDMFINCLVDEISNVGNVSTGLNLTLSFGNVEGILDFVTKFRDFEIKMGCIWFLNIWKVSGAIPFLCLLYFKVSTDMMLSINLTIKFSL